jgi:hypothetical protein
MVRGVFTVCLAISVLIYLVFSENFATNKDTLLLHLDENAVVVVVEAKNI